MEKTKQAYRCVTESFFDNKLVMPGDIIHHNGPVGKNFKKVEDNDPALKPAQVEPDADFESDSAEEDLA